MNQLDPQTLDSLADLICGDSGPVYRKGWELPQFFVRAGVPCPEHDGSTRKWWTLAVLRELSENPDHLEKIVLRLADPREYKGDPGNTQTAVAALNRMLGVEGYAVQLTGGVPEFGPAGAFPAPPPANFVPASSSLLGELPADDTLRAILAERWEEAQKCVEAQAHVAATVMMGSLLEGAILAVVLANPEQANRSTCCPKAADGKPKPFRDWSLSDLINVAHKCGWLTAGIRDFGHVLRDYRNLIHPWQHRETGARPDAGTSAICWEVAKAAINDLAASRRE